jgi:hypothetical protein
MYSDPSGHVAFLTMLGIVLVSSLIGAASGATVGGITYAIEAGDNFNLRDFGASIAGGAISGAITGAVSGVFLVTGGTAGVLAGTSALTGLVANGTGSIVEGAINGQLQKQGLQYWETEVFSSVLWGGALGGAFGAMVDFVPAASALAQKAGTTVAKQLTKIFTNKVLKKSGQSFLENLLWDSTAWVTQFSITKGISAMIG